MQGSAVNQLGQSFTPIEAGMIRIAKEYFRRVDARSEDLFDLFTDDVEIYFPKCGTGRGKASFMDFGQGLGG